MSRVIVVALDAMEATVFQRLLAEGRLPNLRSFTDGAAALTVHSKGSPLHGSIWPTFATGLPAGQHGVYFWTQWYAQEMRHLRNSQLTNKLLPFWTELISQSQTATIIDMPYVPPVIAPGFNTARNWGLHDEEITVSEPGEFLPWIERRFGRNPLVADTVEPQSMNDKVEMAAMLRRAVTLRSALVEELAGRQETNLLITCFSETHKAGHYLSADEMLSDRMSSFDAMASIIEPLDEAWPRILAAAGSDAHVVLVALHGMYEQRDYESMGPQILALLEGREIVDPAGQKDMLRRVRELVPDGLHRAIWQRLPPSWRAARQHQLKAVGHDFEHERIFTVVHDTQPAVRLNLQGREAAGIVSEAEAAKLLDALEKLALSLKTDSGEGAYTGLWRATIEEPGPLSHRLPDAFVMNNRSLKEAHRLHAPGGVVLESTHVEARNGAHTSTGFCYLHAAGDSGLGRREVDNLDFAPSILKLLGVEAQRDFEGSSFVI